MQDFELRAMDADGFVVRHPLRCRDSEIVTEVMQIWRTFSGLSVELWLDGAPVSRLPVRC